MNQLRSERELQQRIEDTLADDASIGGVEVLDVELVRHGEGLVRIWIDAEDGVTHELCAQVTHVVRPFVDEQLEVSSPGPERPLRHMAHFAAHVGEAVRVRRTGDHRARIFTIQSVDEASDSVLLQHPEGELVTVPVTEIVRCRLTESVPGQGARQ